MTEKDLIPQPTAHLAGVIDGEIQLENDDCNCRFLLRTQTGKFQVRLSGLEQIRVAQSLQPDDQIYVVGTLHSFVSKRCRSHHTYVMAKIVLPVEDSPSFYQLMSLLNMQIATN